jgi:hypothetical protein
MMYLILVILLTTIISGNCQIIGRKPPKYNDAVSDWKTIVKASYFIVSYNIPRALILYCIKIIFVLLTGGIRFGL